MERVLRQIRPNTTKYTGDKRGQSCSSDRFLSFQAVIVLLLEQHGSMDFSLSVGQYQWVEKHSLVCMHAYALPCVCCNPLTMSGSVCLAPSYEVGLCLFSPLPQKSLHISKHSRFRKSCTLSEITLRCKSGHGQSKVWPEDWSKQLPVNVHI